MKDLNGRPYARLDQLKAGDKVETDGDFTCRPAGQVSTVEQDDNGPLYIPCNEDRHDLDGQLDEKGYLIGVYKVNG